MSIIGATTYEQIAKEVDPSVVRFTAQVEVDDSPVMATPGVSLEEAEDTLRAWKDRYQESGLVVQSEGTYSWKGYPPNRPGTVVTGVVIPQVVLL